MEHYKLDMLAAICNGKLNEQGFKLIFYRLLCSLRLMHSCNIIHRDLKPANILLNPATMEVVICDFGLARTLPLSCLGKHNGNTSRVRDSVLKGFKGREEACSNEIRA